MEKIRIMEAKISTFYADVEVPFWDSTFLPNGMFGSHSDIISAEEIARDLGEAVGLSIRERKDYSRYAAVLKWAKTCNAILVNLSLEDYGNGRFIKVELAFCDLDSLVAFQKDFNISVKGATI